MYRENNIEKWSQNKDAANIHKLKESLKCKMLPKYWDDIFELFVFKA